jgi:DNA-directed RNA polymerase specialized sigma24 family protein
VWTRQAKFSALVEAYSGNLYRFAFWLCKNEATAQAPV